MLKEKLNYALRNNETIHNNTIAPTVEVTRLPIIPPAAIPKRPNIQPPSTAPIIPTTRLTIKPKPPPLINLPAIKPANIPIIINHNQPKFGSIKLFFKIINIKN